MSFSDNLQVRYLLRVYRAEQIVLPGSPMFAGETIQAFIPIVSSLGSRLKSV